MRCHACDSASMPPPAPFSRPLSAASPVCLCLLSAPVLVLFAPLASWGALCSCPLFVSASLLSAPSPSSSQKLGLLGHQYLGDGGGGMKGMGWSAPSLPGDYFNHLLLPRLTIHIYEIERTDTRMWGYGWQGKLLPQEMPELHFPQCPGGTGLPLPKRFLGIKVKEWVGGYHPGGWDGIRKWCKDCRAGWQLWLGLEPLTYFFSQHPPPSRFKDLGISVSPKRG